MRNYFLEKKSEIVSTVGTHPEIIIIVIKYLCLLRVCIV